MKITPEDSARFLVLVEQRGPDECWPWTGKRAKEAGGYGRFFIEGRMKGAHRVAYAIANGGALADNPRTTSSARQNVVMHSCDHPWCVNPKHLSLGTHAENIRHRLEKRRGLEGIRNRNAKLTDDDILEIRRTVVDWDSMCDMMKKHKVNQSSIERVVARMAWRHVPEEESGSTC